MSYTATDLDRQLAALKQQWKAAQDQATKDSLHAQASQLRSSGANEAVANWLVDGTPEGAGVQYAQSYMGADYDPYKQLLSAATNPTPTATTNPTIGASAPQPTVINAPQYQGVDMSPLYGAINTYGNQTIRTPQASTPQMFNWQQLAAAYEAQRQAGGDLPTPDAPRFNTPEGFGGYINQVRSMLAPHVQSQQQQATSAHNRAMQNLRSRLANQGMQNTGTAMAQQRAGAGDLANTYANLDANALAQALQFGVQAGELSMREAQQVWAQKMQRAGFEYGRASDYTQNLAGGLGMQEQMRHNERGLDLNVQQLEHQRAQSILSHLSQALGMDIGQSQFGAGHALNWAQLGENARQFDSKLGEEWRQFNTRMGEDARQFDTGMQYNWAQHFQGTADKRLTLAEQQRQFDAQHKLNQSIHDLNADKWDWAKTQEEAKIASLGTNAGVASMDIDQMDKYLNTLNRVYNSTLLTLDGGQQALMNAIEASDWSDLGKQLTYKTGTDKKLAVAMQPALDVLNEIRAVMSEMNRRWGGSVDPDLSKFTKPK